MKKPMGPSNIVALEISLDTLHIFPDSSKASAADPCLETALGFLNKMSPRP
jgi:hypothetical protein